MITFSFIADIGGLGDIGTTKRLINCNYKMDSESLYNKYVHDWILHIIAYMSGA